MVTTILYVLGTRPETIKLAPLIHATTARGLRAYVVHTGQHHDANLNANFFGELGLRAPDAHLEVGSLSQCQQLARMLEKLEPVLLREQPALVLVQGDTTSTLAGALAASKLGVPVVHLEAGLRSYDRRMPEEHNRRMVDHVADVLLAPTPRQALLLQQEGIPAARVHTVGNSIADALQAMLKDNPAAADQALLARHGVTPGRFAFMTLHRQENVDDPAVLRGILDGIQHGIGKLPVLFPVHPRTAAVLQKHAIPLPGCFQRLQPIGYKDSLLLQRHAAVVLTDSGGLQEEACMLGTPCVTLRSSTERPETVDCGANQIAGCEPAAIARAIGTALGRPRDRWQHPYGSDVANRCLQLLQAFLADRAAATAPAATTTPAPAGKPGILALPSDGDFTGRTLGQEEVELAARAIRSGTLNSTKGTFVARFEKEFAQKMGRKHAIACASGSAAVHCAIAALKLKAGDEVITTPITDMGALTPISYEGGVPVFADVDPVSINLTADTIRPHITSRTRAIVVTHLFGLPCDMAPIMALARQHDLIVIEDMAQSFLAVERTGRCGTFGHIATFSLQQGKHMTTGEGGAVTTDDPKLAREVFLFVNKAWGYGDPKPDHYFPALNYRLTELQGAVALAQMQKLDWVVQRRREVAGQISCGLHGVPGLLLPQDPPGGQHTWWKYAFFVDPAAIRGGAVELGKRMKDRGVFCVPRYIQKPAFECQLYQDFHASPVTGMPLLHNPRKDQKQPLFHRQDYPGAVRALDRVIVLPINELYTQAHVDYVTTVIREEAKVLTHA